MRTFSVLLVVAAFLIGTGSFHAAEKTLVFGLHPSANFCITNADDFLGYKEAELPPTPPSEVPDIRFVDPRLLVSPCFGEGAVIDWRPLTSLGQQDSFVVKFQLGENGLYPITVTWPAGLSAYASVMRLRDVFGGVLFDFDMLTTTSAQIQDPHTQFQIYMVSNVAPLRMTTSEFLVDLTVTIPEEVASGMFLSLDPDSIFNEDPAKPGKSKKPAKRGKGLMPNWSNLLAETVLQGGFAPGASESDDAGGMRIGIAYMFNAGGPGPAQKWKPVKDSANVRAWARLTKWDFKKDVGTGWAALQKTLRNKEFNHYDSDPTETPRGFDSTGYPGLAGRKPMTKQLSKLDPKKTPNKLFAELVALKFNIAASQMEKTPAGFGDLIYVNPSSGFDGMSVMDISAAADQMMTYWQGVDQADYDDLYSVVYAINRAFLGPIDTVSFEAGGKLVLNGAVDVADVPFLTMPLGPRPFVPTTLTPRNNYVEGFEDDFEDEEWEAMEGTPVAAKVYPNYPNPFNPSTTISFNLRKDSYVTLKIFNMLGQEVATLLNGEELEEGYQTVEFHADRLASGVYVYHLRVEDVDGGLDRTVVTKKMVLLK